MKTIARFEIGYEQFLNEKGTAVKKRLPSFAKDAEEMLRMYRIMMLTRVFDTRSISLQRTGKLGTYASCLGHEAAHVGAAAAMSDEDVLAVSYREYGAQFCRGVKPQDVLMYWGGSESGSNFEGPSQDFAWCVPIATQTLHGTGAALAFKLRKERRAAVAFVGDGGTSEGAFHEALNAAGVWDLPIVFVIVNNQWAISVPLASQTKSETLAQKAIGAGLPGIQVDGNDVIAVRHVTGEALEKAKNGRGPTVIEAKTYRLSDHTTADDARRYRPAQEVEAAHQQEPLIRTKHYLESIGIWNEEKEDALLAECKAQVEAAVRDYMNSPKPPVSDMFDYMYAELPQSLQEQRHLALSEDNDNG